MWVNSCSQTINKCQFCWQKYFDNLINDNSNMKPTCKLCTFQTKLGNRSYKYFLMPIYSVAFLFRKKEIEEKWRTFIHGIRYVQICVWSRWTWPMIKTFQHYTYMHNITKLKYEFTSGFLLFRKQVYITDKALNYSYSM